ncbi:16S rRNA (adenine(1518)-N(6)/adenine(1519)-N(6))-dimethyltransferase RsmA [Sphingopyxis yananensis]|uniref:16S rRNA (adenine(1518)-N(6)/adenine(1519)-N(6))- dimethyltransferase RsmA n=1 Tax=Sphingopyxis yananensis TaxID=2886687 RepID=UPI001D116EDA|nr:16S rRNA (adenine(1518)-N(6)/adenine(1519)-N(6))-dimethyltransferase RsmA [Sphingopyxis yananensis]MCC2603333.1 16S rRNA (adenine(1518)-N(6)/adenine(1519)-N(6))-dimethyltransferase RsmA [Sphingopyxis yananensis]
MPTQPLHPLPPLREAVKAHGLSASKALGQNFLFDEQLLDRIAAIPGNLDEELVFEVGPGPGGLTRACLRAGAQVIAVERDDRAMPLLAELSDAFPNKLQVLADDALNIDVNAVTGGRPYHIIANLPYNVGTLLFTRWLEPAAWPPQWKSLTLMFQQEVAERIVAPVGSNAYGRLAVLAQWRCNVKIAMKVHRSAFTPPPKVMSAIVHLTPADEPAGVNPRILSRLTEKGFGQRRKMLRQSLKGMDGAIDACEALGIDPTRRAETVSVAEWVALARALSASA